MNALTTTQQPPFGSGGLVPHNMAEALQLAEFMSRARTVPKHLQGSPGDCLMVIEQAMRWGMSPFAVAQATSVISGKMMYEGKLVAAAVETSGAILGQIDYEYSGEGANRSIKVSATRRGETNPRTLTVNLKDARTDNVMWTRQPDQQLAYHGVRVWARRWTPAVILGVYSREEMGPVIEGTAEPASERDAINAAVPLQPAADPTVDNSPRQQNQKTDAVRQQPTRTRGQFLDALSLALNDAQSAEEADRIMCSEDSLRAKETFEGPLKERYDGIIRRALEKWFSEPPLDEVEITGQDKLEAG